MAIKGAGMEVTQLQTLRNDHLGRLLLQAHRAFTARAIALLNQHGYNSLTMAHIALLPHLDESGTRVTTLADRSGMTKQGMGQLVKELESQGFLERRPDPLDGRALLVTFTDSGLEMLRHAVAITQQIEREYQAILGEDRILAFKGMLRAVS